MSYITVREYAKKNWKSETAVRQMINRGGLLSAVFSSGKWYVDENEPYPDRRSSRPRKETQQALTYDTLLPRLRGIHRAIICGTENRAVIARMLSQLIYDVKEKVEESQDD